MQFVLSLFPGADLLGKAFEEVGFCVVRGPDILWGGDIKDFHVPPGKFDGVIGGPPCQKFSAANQTNKDAHLNLIPEFLRVIEEARPKWAVMENVMGALSFAPKWPYTKLVDWDCSGNTKRKRLFWFYGITPPTPPNKRIGDGAYTVCATHYRHRVGTKRTGMHLHLTAEEAALLQGYNGLHTAIMMGQPKGLSARSKEILATHMLGNGVPHAMGKYVAEHVKKST